jgi:hypothetical protein
VAGESFATATVDWNLNPQRNDDVNPPTALLAGSSAARINYRTSSIKDLELPHPHEDAICTFGLEE